MKCENPTQQALRAWQKASRLAPPPTPPQLHYYMPAMPPIRVIHALDMAWWHCRRRWLFRRHIVPLLAHDDQILRDIGHCREDILWASQLPLKVDAIHALEARQRECQLPHS